SAGSTMSCSRSARASRVSPQRSAVGAPRGSASRRHLSKKMGAISEFLGFCENERSPTLPSCLLSARHRRGTESPEGDRRVRLRHADWLTRQTHGKESSS